MADALPLLPEISDEDIEWVRAVMGLEVFDDPRREFLRATSTLDVSACPGSGKTTLIVAKLAILARKWPHRTKGICVLSHTNVARQEIQRRLGSTVVGQRLLDHPHFMDTIHGFVNRFLALPWLNSNGFPSPTIDDEVATSHRRGVLTRSEYGTVHSFLAKKYSGFDRLRICARDLSFDLGGKAFPAGKDAKSYLLAKKAVETAAKEGYFCYDEMFVWARALLQDHPKVASWLRCRFPFVMIDEMQDTFEAQGAVLHTIFPRFSTETVVQRVGDPNQAIFHDLDGEPDKCDPFPDPDSARCLGIPNSYRFGPGIAALASPFAVISVGTNGLIGIGPRPITGAQPMCRHSIFIFPDDNTAGVLDAYGKHVLNTFGDNALANGVVTAVGAVHQDASDVTPGHPHFPKSVPHYWSGYSAELSRKDLHPRSLVQYVRAAQVAVREGRDLSSGVEKVASGLIRLASRVGDVGHFRKTRTHHAVTDLLARDTQFLSVYRRLLKALLIDWMPLTEASWAEIQNDLLSVACALCNGSTHPTTATDFLAWPGQDLSPIAASPGLPSPNLYRVSDGVRCVDIRLGSIHSVKGQTHLATLVLNTYWHAHSSVQMLPWLLGWKGNGRDAGVRDLKRLLQTYVAMTRPSHLVCFAVPRFIFGDDASGNLEALMARGWHLAKVFDGVACWHK